MLNFLSAIYLFLMSFWAYAADDQKPVDTTVSASDEIGIIIFGLIFFGLIFGYFGYLYWGKKKNKDGDKSKKE
jgi:hypothetical protein